MLNDFFVLVEAFKLEEVAGRVDTPRVAYIECVIGFSFRIADPPAWPPLPNVNELADAELGMQ